VKERELGCLLRQSSITLHILKYAATPSDNVGRILHHIYFWFLLGKYLLLPAGNYIMSKCGIPKRFKEAGKSSTDVVVMKQNV
jgi:hypothetical protein